MGVILSAEVLKVPHHGSATGLSTTQLQAVRPQVALISVGAGNGYGLPAPPTLALPQQANVPALRTHLNGTMR